MPRKRTLTPPSPEKLAQPRTRGRPKKVPGEEKAEYTISLEERARRRVRMKLKNAEKGVKQAKKQAEAKTTKVRNLKKSAKKVEDALNGSKTRVVDQGDLENLPPAVADLIDDTPVVFRPNP